MKAEFSLTAVQHLEAIWDYHASVASEKVADRIAGKILTEIDWLFSTPRGGQVEPLLDHLNMGHLRFQTGSGQDGLVS